MAPRHFPPTLVPFTRRYPALQQGLAFVYIRY